jgi:xanthine dehydrogenase accessory factor
VDYALTELVRFFVAAKRHAEPLVLATILRTEGSTYRKAGSRVLITADGKASGLLSGGCLETDLRAHARRVHANLTPERVWFDSRKTDDPIWGFSMGCEGAIDVWLQASLPADHYPLINYFKECLDTETPGTVATVVGGEATPEELGAHGYARMAGGTAPPNELSRLLANCTTTQPELRRLPFSGRELEVFVTPVGLPPSLLLCGAGGDAVPINAFATALGWRVTVYDHRPAYAARELFPQALRVLLGVPENLPERVNLAAFDAAIIMSHHLPSDIAYLKCLVAAPPAHYIGILGPAARRQHLFAAVGDAVQPIAARIHGPAGLDIGASTADTIALSIVAQIHAVLAGRAGGAFAGKPLSVA